MQNFCINKLCEISSRLLHLHLALCKITPVILMSLRHCAKSIQSSSSHSGTVCSHSGHPSWGRIPKLRSFYTELYPQTPVILHWIVSSDSGHPAWGRIPRLGSSYTGLYPHTGVSMQPRLAWCHVKRCVRTHAWCQALCADSCTMDRLRYSLWTRCLEWSSARPPEQRYQG